MAAVEHRDRQHVEDGKVHVEQYEKIQCQAVVGFHHGAKHREDADWAAQVADAHASLLRVKQGVERPPHERADFRDVLPRRWAGVALDVNPWAASELHADHHLALDHPRRDRQRDIFAVPANADLRRLAAVLLQLVDQLALATDRDSAERNDFVILFQAGLRGGLALEYSSHDRRELRRKIKRLDRDLVADRSGRQHVGELVAIPQKRHRETVCQRQGGQLVGFLPRRNRLVVDLGDDVAFADAE